MNTADCACFNLRKASRAITHLYDEVLRSTGLRTTQFTILRVLHSRGEMPITQLAWELVMDRTTLTRNLRPLVRQGLITITSGSDRRTREVKLTDQGRDVVKQALPLWEKAQRRVVEGLGEERWHTMLADLAAAVALAR